jgi:FtsP/CotA-like multicopper oxidase with cupredoxin domain
VEDNTFTDPDLPSWAANERLLQVSVSSVKGTVGNGKTNEVIDIDADQWYRLRVSIVAAYAEPKNFTFDDSGDCNVTKVASDGIWRSSIPRPSASVYELTGASRADFAIRCVTPNSLVPLLYDGDLIATIRVGSSEPNPHVMEEWKPKRPNSLQDLRTLSLPQDGAFDIKLGFDYVNDQKWDPEIPLDTIAYDQVHEWTLQQTVRHPFHLHLYHMQVVTPGGCGAHEEGEWYDTISAPGNCTVRFFTADFGQMCVLHCHVLFHEDAGSMSWVDVTGLNMPRNDVQSFEYSCPAIASPPTASPASDAPSASTGGTISDAPSASTGGTSSAAGPSRWFSILVATVLVQWMFQ